MTGPVRRPGDAGGEALRLGAVFHLNLAYSAIEEDQRREVLRRCYWPLLQLARERGLPLGIEATGYTLEEAARIDPAWVEALGRLVRDGPCELVGSGYAQVIGPLVPPEVNAANLRSGREVCRRLLGLEPRVAWVAEQAFSAGLVSHYREAGYRALVMEWENAASAHPGWSRGLRYLPQRARDGHGAEVAILWSSSVLFQRFQRHVYGEIERDEYLDRLAAHAGPDPRFLMIYASDAEVFDYRPGRYPAEPSLEGGGEWERIGALLGALEEDPRFEMVAPGAVLSWLRYPGAGTPLDLTSAAAPIPVKKQPKYNVVRWAVSGRDDLGINTACWRIYRTLMEAGISDEGIWRELCSCWSSDYRTHITARRWGRYRERLAALEKRVALLRTPGLGEGPRAGRRERARAGSPGWARVVREGRLLRIDTDRVRLRLNCRRGLAVEALAFPSDGEIPWAGTIPQGAFDDIALGADFYTGHLVLEAPGRPKLTDLQAVEPVVTEAPHRLSVRAEIRTPLGPLTKEISLAPGSEEVTLSYLLDWPEPPRGSLRLGHLTLDPRRFDGTTLLYRTHQGGFREETFRVGREPIDHGSAVSCLVSARQGLGMTSGWAELGDATRVLRVELEPAEAAMIGLVTFQPDRGSYLFRLALSLSELDETALPTARRLPGQPLLLRLTPRRVSRA